MQAAPYMQIFIDLVVSGTTTRNLCPASSDSVCQIQLAAAKALLTQLIWFNTLASVSTGSAIFLNLDYAYLLESEAIDMKGISGCQNWVVKAMSDISILQLWKKLEEGDRKLSIIELATKGGALLKSLNHHVAWLDDPLHQNFPRGHDIEQIEDYANMSDQWWLRIERETTRAFARAAIIYLHVVMSGPNPHLEEIRRVVPDLVESLKNLANGNMMQYASWPLCVAMCFANDEEQRIILSSLDLEGTNSRKKHFRTCAEALTVAQLCHSMREEGRNLDWIMAMDSLQKRILLV